MPEGEELRVLGEEERKEEPGEPGERRGSEGAESLRLRGDFLYLNFNDSFFV